ncbi:MAG: S8 family serine peptidase [Bdellovibrionales bacterium]|nr:S8 family serine peptidase [Bdellovibrionales bacterium]
MGNKKIRIIFVVIVLKFLSTAVFAKTVPMDPDYNRQWGLKNDGQKLERAQTPGFSGVDIGIERAWDFTTGSREIIVAVSDSGIDLKNPDLQKNLWVNQKEKEGLPNVDDDGNGYVDDIYGWDFANDDNDPTDDNQHGTHIAGIIGAQGNNRLGIAGINWKVRIMAVKWLDSGLRGSTEDAAKSLHYAMDMGAKVINCSWGEDNDVDDYEPPKELVEAIRRAERENVLIVAAAGNEGYDLKAGAFYPASFKSDHLISVAAVNNQAQLWEAGGHASNYGAQDVDIAAPGEDIPSYALNGVIKPLSGTSMAAPFVSGVAALMLSKDPSLSAPELKRRILNSAKTYPHLRTKIRTAGVVNAYYALNNESHPLDLDDPFNGNHISQELAIKDYPLSSVQYYTLSHPGAHKIAVHFKKFHLTFGDSLTILNSDGEEVIKYNGEHSGKYSPYVKGDTITLKLKSDDFDYNGQGIFIDHIATQI